jgi:iron complex outermembrane recepter protein
MMKNALTKTKNLGITPFVVALSLISMISIANAQNVLEEVVVTAQKREQGIQDVGIAITAFTGDQMRALGIEESFDIASFSPGVHISGNLAGQNTQFSIRGVTQNDFNDIIEAPTAVYLDEGYIAVAQAQTFALFDVERVEILKGPQGTLYGRNATGGLVNYVSNKPSFDGPDGYLEMTYGQFDTSADADQWRVEGALGGPLGDTVAARVAFMYNQHDGYLDNLYPLGAVGAPPGAGAGVDLGDDDTFAFRGTLLFEPNEDLSLSLSVNAAGTDVATGPYQSKPTIGVYNATGELINTTNVAPGDTRRSIAADGSDFGSDQNDDGVQDDFFDNVTGAFATGGFTASGTPIGDGIVDVGRPPGTDFFGYLDPDGEDFKTSGDFAFEDSGHTDTKGLNAKLVYDLSDSMALTMVSDYKDYEKLLFIDVDSAPVNQLANYGAVDAKSFTQEIRLNGEGDRSRWVLGFYYLNIDSVSDNGLKITPNGVAGAAQDVGTDADLQTDSYSIFGHYEWDMNDQITLIGGLRLIQEEKDFEMDAGLYFGSTDARKIHQGAKFLPPLPFGLTTSIKASSSDTLWAGKLQIDYKATDDLLLYAGVNRGVKAGSFNAPLLGSYISLLFATGNDGIPYKEEILLSYEGGFKATMFGGSTRLNGSVFYYDYDDYQAFLFTGIGGVVINADAENYGVELELQTSPFEGFDAVLSMSWFDATVKDVPNKIGSTITRDVDPTYAPEFQFAAMARYEWPAFNGMMNITGDLSYSDDYFYNLRNFDADKFDSYVMVNMGLGWGSEDGHWEARFKVNNVTDERAGIQGFNIATACGCNEISFRAPRWYGINVRYNY